MVQCGQVPGGAETAPLSEAELSEYCRRKGIEPKQIRQWRAACEQANAKTPATPGLAQRREEQTAQKRIQDLEREFKRKNAALAETAALLVLRKKPRRSGEGTRRTDPRLGSPRSHCVDR